MKGENMIHPDELEILINLLVEKGVLVSRKEYSDYYEKTVDNIYKFINDFIEDETI
jgi:hypothetical protein